MPSLSASKYQTFQTCRRLFYWEYIRFIERVRQEGARAFGSLYHLGLEQWWKLAGDGDVPWKDIDEALVAAIRAIDDSANHIDTDAYDVARARAMLIGYHAVYFELEFKLLGSTGGTEEWFRGPLRDPDGDEVKGWTISGRKDAIAHLATNARPSVIEHKSTSSDISPESDYWMRTQIDGQATLYIEAGNAAGLDVGDVLWDASRKPNLSPERETPEADREMTKGRGCKDCGGSAKAGAIKKGTGVVKIADPTAAPDDKEPPMIEAPCPTCDGTGWKPGDAPRYKADVVLKDEPPIEYQARLARKIEENPMLYFRMGSIKRTPMQLAEGRANLVAAAIEIDALYERTRRATGGNLSAPAARYAFAQNTAACLNIYGRRCDFFEVCVGSIQEPAESQLYRIKPKRGVP